MTLTDGQKKQLFAAIVTFLLAVAAVFGYDMVIVQPRETTRPGETVSTAGPPVAERVLLGREYESLIVRKELTSNELLQVNGTLAFEGTTANAYETTLTATDPTADRTVTLPNMSGTVLVTNTPGAVVFGTNTVTGTLAISHGLTTPQTVLCTLRGDPVDNEEQTCSAAISGATVTLKVWKEGAIAGDSGVSVMWMVAGQP